MRNIEKLKQVIEAYKAEFSEYFDEESYKWEAIKCFQDNWDIDYSTNFADMLKKSLAKTDNLLNTAFFYPKAMILNFANANPQKVREMFANLYDERKNLSERIQSFINQSEELRKKYNDGKWKNHYQTTNAITTYLWLKYPDKYYIYKYELYKKMAEAFSEEYRPKRDGSTDDVINGFKMYDEIRTYLINDKTLQDILSDNLTNECYPDKKLVTLTIDFGFYFSRYYHEKTNMDTPTYLQEIIAVLEELGGTAHLSDINAKIKERDKLPYIKTNPNWERQVSASLQSHCRETQTFKEGNSELFYSVNGIGKGVWGLIGFKNTEIIESIPSAEKENSYTKEDFLNQVYITEKEYDTLTALLEHKKNVILQGTPGVGKTFTAKRLAYAIMGEKDDSRIEFVQFHQSYSYEDFIMGYRPTDDGSFQLRKGVFYRFCDKARNDPNRKYFFIIDEINRGNLSKIFGEMLMLIEADKRGDKLKLTYQKEDDEPFSIPDNVYIIGMMNTADRSLAMIDYALRRRFSFFEMEPCFDSEGFKAYSDSLSNDYFNALIAQIKLLNKDIEKDSSLGKGFCIGHSYFCNLTTETCTDERLREIVEYDIIPMLSEYWFDDRDKADKWSANLRGLFNDD